MFLFIFIKNTLKLLRQYKRKIMTPEEILKTKKTYAIIGASNEVLKYGYELVCVFNDSGYEVLPVNPKYDEIDGIKCYPSLKDLPEKPEVIITALAPANTEKVVKSLPDNYETLWLPPNCFNEETVSYCKENNINFVYNVCPIGLIRKMNS
jgi:predicted CoA-binding protein